MNVKYKSGCPINPIVVRVDFGRRPDRFWEVAFKISCTVRRMKTENVCDKKGFRTQETHHTCAGALARLISG
jgi:hypothetical protein